MNKFWKNTLFIFLTILVIFLITYIGNSFKSVFNSYRVDETKFVDAYFLNTDEKYIYFVIEKEAYYVNKGKTIICGVDYEDKFITLENEDEKFKYKVFVINDNRFLSLDDNCYFDRLENQDEK